MKKLRLSLAMIALVAVGILAGCSETVAKSPDVSDSIRKSLDQEGFKDVSITQDRDKGIVTLGGQVASEDAKAQAQSLAKSLAGAQVVANQIAVVPVGVEKEAKAVNSDLDQGIEKNLDAALIREQHARQREIRREERRSHVDRRSELAEQTQPSRESGFERAQR